MNDATVSPRIECQTAAGVVHGGLDVAGSASSHLLIAADGPGGHGTGGIAARLVARTIADRLGRVGVRHVGAAEDLDEKRYAASRHREVAAKLPDVPALPEDLALLFEALSVHLAADRLSSTCIAATIDGTHVRGAHFGIGRALLIRSGAARLEDLVVEHLLALVRARVTDPALLSLPPELDLVVSSLGVPSVGGLGVDRFEAQLQPGDVILLASRRWALGDAALVEIVHRHRGASIDALARVIEQSAEAASREAPSSIAFALARCPDPSAALSEPMEPLVVAARDLHAHPDRYDGCRLRFRALVREQLEGMSICGAWWTPRGPLPGPGVHLADVEGEWRSVRAEETPAFGHFNLWRSQIVARVAPIAPDAPRAYTGRIGAAPELEWLESSGDVHCMMQGQFWQGHELHRVPRGLFERAREPHVRAMRAVYFHDGDDLYVATFQWIGEPRPLAPRRVAPDALGTLVDGDFIEVEGELALGGPYPFPRAAGQPEYVNWPKLEGVLTVQPPGTEDHYTVPSTTSPGLAPWLELLAGGPRRVRAVGEVQLGKLWTTSLELVSD